MTSFQSLTRRAPTQHATLGDNHGGSDIRAPSSDSGFASDPDSTSGVHDNLQRVKLSFAKDEVIRLK